MHSLVFALDLKQGDEVIVPTYTFFATFSPFAYEGITIVQADCDEFGQINPDEVRKKISPRTKAIVCTHMWGVPCDMDELSRIALENGLALIEDCSHAHVASYKGRQVGSFGIASIFSTNQKLLTSGEGGYLLTPNRDVFERAVLFGHYNERCKSEIDSPAYKAISLTGLGLKYRATSLSAAILIDQIQKAPDFVARRRQNLRTLSDAVSRSNWAINIVPAYEHEHGLYVFPFRAKDGVTRQRFLAFVAERGYDFFDAPGSTKPLFDEPLFNNPTICVHRPELTESSVNPRSTDFPKAIDFHDKILKCALWGYEGDAVDVTQCANLISEFANVACH